MFISINFKKEFIYFLYLIPLSLLKLAFNSTKIKKGNLNIIEYISKILLINPYLYQKISQKDNKIITNKGKININHILLVIIVIFFYLINVHIEQFNLNNFYLEIISIQFIDLIFFRKQFYSHHILSLILIIFSLSIIIINEYDSIKSLNVIILIIIKNYCESFSILLIKYINTVYFTNIYLLGSLIGLFSFIFQLIQIKLNNLGFEISLIYYFIICLLLNIMYFYIIFKLDAIHATLCYHISYTLVDFLTKDTKLNNNILLFYLFSQILILYIYLEILELKFCGLNKNIKSNIIKRSEYETKEIINKNNKFFKNIIKTEKLNDD